jgi:hypothetical protein
MMTAFAVIASPSSNRTTCTLSSDGKRHAFDASLMRTPNFWACSAARAASSSPEAAEGTFQQRPVRVRQQGSPASLGDNVYFGAV